MFIKYPSIENHYNTKFINKSFDAFPDLNQVSFLMTEKLHGTNIQIIIDNGAYQLATRNKILQKGENHFGLREYVLKNHMRTINILLGFVREYKYTSMNVYAELFGPGIMKGVDYGDEKKLRVFKLCLDGVPLSAKKTRHLMVRMHLGNLLVPSIGITNNLEGALAFDVENLKTAYNNTEGNIAEGIVIEPYEKWVQLPNDKSFILKKKSEKFIEKSRSKKEPMKVDAATEHWHKEFLLYINKNRMENVFSKAGKIQDITQLGEYIKMIILDAKKEFQNDFGDVTSALNHKERKYVFNVGRQVAEMLKECL